MKTVLKYLFLLSATLAYVACEDLKPQLADLDARVSALEGTRITTIEQQIQAIQTSLTELKEMDKTLKGYIDVLNEKDIPELQEAIKQLQAKDAELENKIKELQTYVDTQLANQKDWVNATFCTLEQYQALVNQVAGLESSLNEFKKTVNEKYTELSGSVTDLGTSLTNWINTVNGRFAEIDASITALEASMKGWVNEALSKYYDIAIIDTKLSVINQSIQDGDNTNKADIDELSTSLTKAVGELTAAYQKAISDAIQTNNGVIDKKIADQIEAVNKRIDAEVETLQRRLDNLEERLKAIEDYIDDQKNFTINFDIPEDMVCYPGASVNVPFTLSDSSLETTVECIPDVGWKAVVSMGKNRGDIKITAPETGGDGKILVFANRSSWMIMRSLYIQEGKLTIVDKEYQMPWEGGELKVTVTTNMEYVVEFSGTAGEWITVEPKTKAECREDVLVVTVAENGEDMPVREGIVLLKNANGNVLESFAIHQAAQPTNDPIVFADPIAKKACVEKYDTNGDGEVSYAEAAAVSLLSGLFADYNTVTEFDEICFFTSVTSTQNVFDGLTKLKHITIPDNITTLGTFKNCTSLETVALPVALNSIPAYCFSDCLSLKSVTLPTGIISIPDAAFENCSALENLLVPSTLTSVGQHAFSGCTVLTGIDMPSGFKTIGNYAFQNCRAIVSVGFPASLTSIGQYAFSGCTSLATVVLPEGMTSVSAYCFQNCTKLVSITWPSSLTTIGNNAFEGCRFEDSDYSLQLPASVTSIGSNAFGYLHHLVLPSTTPISIASNSFVSGYTLLYVPSGMVEMYKVRTNWSNYADRIRPMSDYPVTSFTIGTVGEAVDLGLSVKWASWNVGASSPEGYGAYFAWGETDMKWVYDWSTYKWCNGDYNKLTKYCPTNNADYWDGTGSPDGKTVLDIEDDAARANWGGTWRMPTDAEWTELRNNCTWTWTTQNGVNGRLVTSNSNGNSIFLPAAGHRSSSTFYGAGSYGYYWSSSLNALNPLFAWIVYFNSSSVYRYGGSSSCYYGQSVRPVSE